MRPQPDLRIRLDVHKVKLTQHNDLWYQGAGPFQNTSVGCTGQPARGDGGLANYLDGGVDTPITKRLGISFYLGALSGKATLTTAVHGKKGGFGYTGMTYRF